MSKNTIEEELNIIAKKSKNILYSTNVIKIKDEKTEDNTEQKNSKDTKLILRPVKKDEDNYWAIILKYKIDDGIPQEVIMGTVKLDGNSDLKNKTVDIIDLIMEQLQENANNGLGYSSYEKLYEYVDKNNIEFNLTMEGQEILTSKSKEKIKIPRTYFENKQGKIESLYKEEELEKLKEKIKNELDVYMNKIREKEKWIKRREKILSSLHKTKEDITFLKGEKITNFIQEADKDINLQKNMVADYYLEIFKDEKKYTNEILQDKKDYIEQKDDEENLLEAAKKYNIIKEKGLAIDANIILDTLENKCYSKIEEKNGKVTPDLLKVIDQIQAYQGFFNLVKQGRDWNARLKALKINNINFKSMKDLIKTIGYNDKELLQYIDLKEKMVNELQLDSIDVEYKKDSSIGEMYDFLLHSSIRENTKNQDEKEISKCYTKYIREKLIESNFDELNLYNHYAEGSNRPVCLLPEEQSDLQTEQAKNFSNVVKSINKRIDEEIIGKKENSKEKSIQEETKKESEEQR